MRLLQIPFLESAAGEGGESAAPVDSLSYHVPDIKQELSSFSTSSLDDIVHNLITNAVDFAISLAIAIIVFYAGRFLIKQIYRIVEKIMHRHHVDTSVATFVLSLVKISLFFFLIIVVIGIMGIETSSFIALFASAGVAIGMALSGTLQNFAGGVLILLLKPYKVGDYIEAQGYSGTVTAIQIFSTIICTPDNKSIIIPNGGLSTGSINNWSREQYRRIDWNIGISYGDDVATARKAIIDIISADPRIVSERVEGDNVTMPPTVVVNELADSSVNLIARAWVRSSDYWNAYFDINELIYTRLPLCGVSFPFPQMDVHLSK